MEICWKLWSTHLKAVGGHDAAKQAKVGPEILEQEILPVEVHRGLLPSTDPAMAYVFLESRSMVFSSSLSL